MGISPPPSLINSRDSELAMEDSGKRIVLDKEGNEVEIDMYDRDENRPEESGEFSITYLSY